MTNSSDPWQNYQGKIQISYRRPHYTKQEQYQRDYDALYRAINKVSNVIELSDFRKKHATRPFTVQNGEIIPFHKPSKKRAAGTITYQGEALSVREWSEKTGINRETIRQRLRRGLPPEEILKPPPARELPYRSCRSKMITYQGKEWTQAALAYHHKIDPAVFMKRLKRGWSVEDALTLPVAGYNRQSPAK